MTNFNERTNTLLYKNIPLTLYSRKGMFLVRERWVGDGDRLLHINPKFFWPQQHFFRILAGCSTMGHWGPKALGLPLALNSTSCLQLTPTATGTQTDSRRLWHLVIFLFDSHLLPVGVLICHYHRIQPCPQVKVIFRYLRPDAPVSLFFLLFTQAHLLIDGSVEGQYVTIRLIENWIK